MSVEIERRFLLKNDNWKQNIHKSIEMQQGYMSVEKECTIRLRIIDDKAWLTIKGFITPVSRHEFEYPIPISDAKTMMNNLCAFTMTKTRHIVKVDNVSFEIDEYHGANAPLIVAELELANENQTYPTPEWLGEEITDDGRYSNAYLSKHPYSQWDL
ncbi:MAG: CYTH domain-containing protein [Neisseriaceae bacterium]|nr:CYTH domain-containing protein [Neisseriaceae bacterium]